MNYKQAQRQLAAAWKRHTPSLPDAARAPAPFIRDGSPDGQPLPFCLPRDYADHNLLPDVRDAATDLFAALGIRLFRLEVGRRGHAGMS